LSCKYIARLPVKQNFFNITSAPFQDWHPGTDVMLISRTDRCFSIIAYKEVTEQVYLIRKNP
jgi:hypothetical protein